MMTRCFCALCGLALLAASFGLPAAVGADDKSGKEDAVFELREVSVFQKNGVQDRPYSLAVGAYAACSTEPDKAVKAYPKLNSKHPLYGTFLFDRSFSTGKSIEIRFVLDESGETPPAEDEKDDKNAAEKKSDKSQPASPKPSRYDRLYIDLNRDLDLTNDPVLKPLKDPPWQALPPWKTKERMAFEYVHLDVDYGPGAGPVRNFVSEEAVPSSEASKGTVPFLLTQKSGQSPGAGVRPFRILPWLTGGDVGGENNRYTMHFVATAARQGQIRIGKCECDAVLAQPHLITGRFDRPMTALFLKPRDPKNRLNTDGFSGEMLSTVQQVDGQLYTISATPLGDKLTVRPYHGDFGIFKIGPGGRAIKDFAFGGSLQSETMSLALEPDRTGPDKKQEKVREYRVPVGDYTPSLLSIDYGRLHLSLSENYHSDGRPRGLDRPRMPFIKIRKDKPFVLDFSNKPAVLFASPGKDKTFKPGDEISVKAVLIDPVFDIMIRGLSDTSRKKKETIRYGEGKDAKVDAYDRPLSLDPLVTIADSSGKSVAEGPMPFG